MESTSITIIKKLKKIGFSSNTYIEAISILQDKEKKKLNIVPLGFKLKKQYIVARIFRNSRTFNLILDNATRNGFICVTSDAKLFYYSIFEKNKAMNMITSKRICDAVIDFIIEFIDFSKNSNKYITIYLKPLSIEINRRTPRGFTRASALIIEALIWLTKIPYVSKNLRIYYAEYINLCIEGVYRSTTSSLYRSIARNIRNILTQILS